ncbi:MAG: surfeit locus 1 family protein [Gammaproteobacteria bacterium]|jgi:surfeit locus 1 family protein
MALMLRLGAWQLERADFKTQLSEQAQKNNARPALPADEILQQAATDSESWYFRSVKVTGQFDPVHQYLLDNRTFDGRAGYHVLSIFRYGAHQLLVNRGWTPVGADRRVLPDIRIDDQPVGLTGRLAPIPGSGLLLGDAGYGQATWPKVVQRAELDSVQAQLGITLLPVVLLLDPEHPACLNCRWVAARGISADRHRGYAVQWFSLAVTFLVLLGITCFYGNRRRDC